MWSLRIARLHPIHLALAAALLVSLAPACSRSHEAGSEDKAAVPSAAGKPTYSTRGKVRAVGEKKDSVTIAHEDIPNYMKAMTMMFEVEKPSILEGINVGDEVTFTFSDRDGRLFVETITKK